MTSWLAKYDAITKGEAQQTQEGKVGNHRNSMRHNYNDEGVSSDSSLHLKNPESLSLGRYEQGKTEPIVGLRQ